MNLNRLIKKVINEKRILNEGKPCTQEQLDAESCGNCGEGFEWDDRIAGCLCVHPGGGVCQSAMYDGGGAETFDTGVTTNNKGNRGTIQLRETDLTKLIKKLINENKICRCMGQTSYGHDGPIMCNTASHGVQAWWAEDCCNKTMETPEGCWVSSNVGGSGNGGVTKYDEKMVDGLEKFDKGQVGKPKVNVNLSETELTRLIHRVINEKVGNPKEMTPPELFSPTRGGTGDIEDTRRGRVGDPCANPCDDDCDCGDCGETGACQNGCCQGSASMSQVRARALSESKLRRLVRGVVNEENGTVNWWEGKDEEGLLNDLETGAVMLQDFVDQIRDGGNTEKELDDIQEFIEYHIIQFIGAEGNA